LSERLANAIRSLEMSDSDGRKEAEADKNLAYRESNKARPASVRRMRAAQTYGHDLHPGSHRLQNDGLPRAFFRDGEGPEA
jgi:hypothetical protein